MGTGRLDALELEQLEARGFVVRERIFDDDALARLRADCDDLVQLLLADPPHTPKTPAGSYLFQVHPRLSTVIKWEPRHPDVVQGIEPFAHCHEPLRAWAFDARLVEPMRDVVGTDSVDLFTEKLNLKRARTGGAIALHQDYPYWVENSDDPARIGTALLFLDDTDRDNGCVEVVPGSHALGLHSGRSVRGFGSFEMDPDRFDAAALVPLEVPAGTVVYFGSLLVHRSRPNRSDRDRGLLLYSYQPAGHPHSLALLKRLIASRSLID